MKRIRDAFGSFLIPLVLLGSISSVVFLSNENSQLHQKNSILETQLQETQAEAKRNGDAVDRIQKSMLCVVTFFTRLDRTNLVITDIASCTITNTLTGEKEVIKLDEIPQPGEKQSPAPTQSLQAVPQTPQSTQPLVAETDPTQVAKDQPTPEPPQQNMFQRTISAIMKMIQSIF